MKLLWLYQKEFLLYLFIIMAAAFAFIAIPLWQNKISKKLIPLFFISFGVVTFALYNYWGAGAKLVDYAALQTMNDQLLAMNKNPELTRGDILTTLNKLENDIGHSTVALARLGSLYTELGLLAQSQVIWDKIIIIEPNNKEYWMPWLYSYLLINDGKLPPKARIQGEKWVLIDPKQRSIMNLLAMDDYFQENYERAIKAWDVLLEMDKDLPIERKQVIIKAKAMAQAKLNEKNTRS